MLHVDSCLSSLALSAKFGETIIGTLFANNNLLRNIFGSFACHSRLACCNRETRFIAAVASFKQGSAPLL